MLTLALRVDALGADVCRGEKKIRASESRKRVDERKSVLCFANFLLQSGYSMKFNLSC